ncbi:EGF-like repeat and discoidin I-like domain-containing protein 3 [Argopecten irradians]|uniref:EGF-like repeat and discoidin I-like domain-containing protein 3 n=1 Tax=Argopecten irradians TaxID=31199 RepID=UPI00372457D5
MEPRHLIGLLEALVYFMLADIVVTQNAICNSSLVTGPHGVGDQDLTTELPYYFDDRCHPKYARLSSPMFHAFIGSYLQVKLRKQSVITGFVTQGRMGNGQYVQTYNVQYSDNSTVWRNIEDDVGNVKEFPGNTDDTGVAFSMLDAPILASFIRVTPLTCISHCAFRLEILGCAVAQQGTQTCWKAFNVTGISAFDVFSTTKTNPGECGKECHRYGNCYAFAFNYGSGVCQGHSYLNYQSATTYNVTGALSASTSLVYVQQEDACP